MWKVTWFRWEDPALISFLHDRNHYSRDLRLWCREFMKGKSFCNCWKIVLPWKESERTKIWIFIFCENSRCSSVVICEIIYQVVFLKNSRQIIVWDINVSSLLHALMFLEVIETRSSLDTLIWSVVTNPDSSYIYIYISISINYFLHISRQSLILCSSDFFIHD